MAIQLTAARQVALHDRTNEHVRFGAGGADDVQTTTSRGLGLFRSKEAEARNKAQFGTFLEALKADPNYRKADGVAEKAFAAIAKHADTGKPLTSRLMAKAYATGDTALQKLREARAQERDSTTQDAIRLVNTPKLLDDAIERATGGKLKDFTAAAPKDVQDAVKADILDGVRDEVARMSERGELAGSSVEDLTFLIEASAAKRADRIETALAASAKDGGLVKVESLGTERTKPVLERVASFSQERLSARLLSSAGANELFEQRAMDRMGADIRKLDNMDLLRLSRTMLSSDMLETRLALASTPDDPRAASLLRDLNSFEGMVNMELADRALEGLPRGDGRDITGGQLDLLSGVDRMSAKREMAQQSDEYLSGDPTANRAADTAATQRLQGKAVGVPEVVELLRSADLTINLPVDLFSRGGPFVRQDGSVNPEGLQLKNIFQLPEGVKGKEYLARRQIIEQAQIPGLAKRDEGGLDPSLHPISSAVNIGREVGGAAARYGWSFLVMKESVKERATFTPTDSFYAFEAHMTESTVAGAKHGLAGLLAPDSPLSDEGRKHLAEKPDLLPTMFKRLDQSVGRDFGLGHPKTLEDFFYDELMTGIGGDLSEKDRDVIWNTVLGSAIDRSREGNKVASYERLDQIIGGLQATDVVDKLATAGRDGQRVNLGIDKYVEAQVFGGIDLRKDVAAIHFMDFPEGGEPSEEYLEQREAAQAMAKQLGVPLVLFGRDETKKTRLNTDESIKASFPKLDGSTAASKVGSFDAFKKTELPAILDSYKMHEQTFDPEGIHGRRHISRALIYSNVLANVLREKGAEVDSFALYTTTGLHDAGREGNGPDRWEKESAAAADQHMQSRGVTDPEYLELARGAINSSAPASHKTIETGILKSADSLDIMRLYGKEGYKADLLWFMQQDTRIGDDRYIEADHAFRDKLIGEIAEFIKATEPRMPSEPAYEQAVKERDRLMIALGTCDPSEQEQLESDLEVAQKEVSRLKDQMVLEHQEANAKLSSGEIFDRIETELLENQEKYPTLAKYYDPSK